MPVLSATFVTASKLQQQKNWSCWKACVGLPTSVEEKCTLEQVSSMQFYTSAERVALNRGVIGQGELPSGGPL